MHSTYKKEFLGKALLIIWATLCILFFIGTAGKTNYVRWSNLDKWQLFNFRLGNIDLVNYFLDLSRSFTGVAIFSIACSSVGVWFIKAFRIGGETKPRSPLMQVALIGTAFLIGHGLFSLVFMTLGMLYQLTPTYVILTLFIGLFGGFSQLKKLVIKPLPGVNSLSANTPENNSSQLILWLSTSILFLSLLYSTARLSYDATAVYFSDAKLTAITNHVDFFKNDTFVVSAFQTGIQYTALIQVFGDESARMFSWVSGVLFIIFTVALGEIVGLSRRARIILLALLVTSTALLDLMGDGKVDLVSSTLAIAAIYWMVCENYYDSHSISIQILVGLLGGLAMVARPFNIFLIGIFTFLYYLQKTFFQNGFKPSNHKQFLISMFWISIGWVGLGIYHLLANWIILGAPLAFLSTASTLNPTRWMVTLDPDQLLLIRLLYPLSVTFLNTPQSLGNISPLFLAFSPAILIQGIRKLTTISTELIKLLAISSITLLLWISLFFTVLEIRYVLFIWAILFMPLAEIISETLDSGDRFQRIILNGMIFTILSFNILRTIYISMDTYSPLDINGNPQCTKSVFCEYLRSVNEAASPGERVLALTAFRYYLRTDLFICSPRHDEYQKLQNLSQKSSEVFWEEIYRQGYTYVVYENDYTTRHLQFGVIPSPDNTPEWIDLEPIFGGPGDLQVAYKIHVFNPPIEVETICQTNSSGDWEIHSLTP